jgi:predicted lipid carrier protein YhbT
MSENIIQEYLVSYLPILIGKFLAEKPVPNMDGTVFSLQITIEGEKSLTYGITIKNAAEITVTPGEIENPMVAMTFPESIIKPLVKMISSFTGRRQYDVIKDKKGCVDVEIDMPGGWKFPMRTVFNGAREPYFKLSGELGDLSHMATGALDPTQAFMQGKIKINGDLAFALSLTDLNLTVS